MIHWPKKYVIQATVRQSYTLDAGTAVTWLEPIVIEPPNSSSAYLFDTEMEAHEYAQTQMKDESDLPIVGYEVRPLYLFDEKKL